MSRHEYVLFDPLFSDRDAEGMVDVCQRFSRYGMYSAENEGGADIGEGLTQRHDAVLNYLRSGGMHGAGHMERMVRIQSQHLSYTAAGFGIGLTKGLSELKTKWQGIFAKLWPSIMIVLGVLLMFYLE